MPELPEVETIRLGLEKRILDKKITAVSVRKEKIVRYEMRLFSKILKGNSFTKISRRGKLLILTLQKSDLFLLIHLKMTGQLIYADDTHMIAGGHSWPTIKDPLPNKFTHVVIEFADDSNLYFNDMRQFGYFSLVTAEQLQIVMAAYGVEPLSKDFTEEAFEKAFAKRTTILKAVLLNQTVIAGIGNIYADEICFKAGVKPTRRVNTLTKAERKKIYQAVTFILNKAMKYGGTTFSHYRDAEGGKGNFTRLLKVYGKGGTLCPHCESATLIKKKIAGRGTVYCPTCQV